MGKCRVFMRLTPAEAAAVRAFIRKPPSGPARLRAQAIWFSSQGHPVKEIAKLLSVAERSVWNWFDAWRRQGPNGLRDKPIPPIRIGASLSPQQQAQLVAITRQPPASVGMSGYTWNCRAAFGMGRKDLSCHPHGRMGAADPAHPVVCASLHYRAQARVAFPPPEAPINRGPDPAYAQKKRRLTG
jgi:hypothetical protein